MPSIRQIRSIRFFDGDVDGAVEFISEHGGFLVVPAAPALVKLRSGDEIYRQALINADMTIPDSGLMVLLWKISRRESFTRISGLAYLKRLIREPAFGEAGRSFFVLPTDDAKTKLLAWSRIEKFPISAEDCYVA